MIKRLKTNINKGQFNILYLYLCIYYRILHRPIRVYSVNRIFYVTKTMKITLKPYLIPIIFAIRNSDHSV